MKWHNLWKDDWFSYTHYSTQEYEEYIDWIKQVKAEGDRLRDKATKAIDKLQLNQCRPCKYWHEMVENEAGEWAPFCDLFHGNGIQIPCDQRVIRGSDTEKYDELRAWCNSCEETISLQFEELKKLEEIKNKVEEWDRIHMRDRHAAPSILKDLERIIGYEEIDKELLEDFRKELK